jgi:hypothetical protein
MENPLGDVDWIDSRRIRHGNGLLGQALDPLCLSCQVNWRRTLGHVGPASPKNHNGAGLFEVRICMPDGVQVNFQRNGDLSHGGHLLARTEVSSPDRLEHLVADLHVDRHAVILKVDRWDHVG